MSLFRVIRQATWQNSTAISLWIYYNGDLNDLRKAMLLPKSVQEIADVIGSEQALLLIENLPRAYSMRKSGTAGSATRDSGKRTPQATVIMYVPTVPRLNASHEFVRILGWHCAIKLCKAFGGEIMYPAMCAGIQRDSRNRQIHRMAADGMPHKDIAQAVSVSERTIKNVLREKPPEEQMVAANDNGAVNPEKDCAMKIGKNQVSA